MEARHAFGLDVRFDARQLAVSQEELWRLDDWIVAKAGSVMADGSFA